MSQLSPMTNYLCNAIDSTAEYIQDIAIELEAASETIVTSLLEDKKILVCGSGFAAPIAQILTTGLMDQHEFERPGLPAINLSSNAVTLSAMTKNQDNNLVFAKQIRAIGAEGDCLIAFALDSNAEDIQRAIENAKDKGMRVVFFNGGDKLTAKGIKNQTKEVCFKTENLSRSMELALLSVNTLIRSVESRLFGIPL